MQRNTVTTLSQLRVGDRFHYPKRVDVWQVTGQTKGYTTVNLPGLNGALINKYDDMKRGTTPVVFMRHTVPRPGEACLLQDLKIGDVFTIPGDVISEYVKESNGIEPVNTLKPCNDIQGSDFVTFQYNKADA